MSIALAERSASKKAEGQDSAASKETDLTSAKATGIQKLSGQEKPLTSTEQRLFAECETDIKENLKGTFVLGYRLEQIRDQRLYRGTHKTFASYCAEKWDFSKTHANRLIQAHL